MSIVEQGNEDQPQDAAGGKVNADPGDYGEIDAALAQIKASLAKLDEISTSAAENKAAIDNHAQTLGTLNQRVAGLQELGAALTEDLCWVRDRSIRWLDEALPASRIDAVYKQIKAVRSQTDTPDATVVALTRLVKQWLVPAILVAAGMVVIAVII